MAEGTSEATKPKRGRSPSYPGIDLREALERAKTLYDKEGRNAAPVTAIYGHWGYKPDTGPALITVAALKKFGLLFDEGTGPTRKARLSEDALRILLDDREDSIDRERAIQEAALKPTIHAELWAKYGADLPSDATLRFELQTERAFTKRGVREFIPQYKATLAFAELTEGAKLAGDDRGKPEDENEDLMAPPTTMVRPPYVAMEPSDPPLPRIVQLPISPSEWAALQAPFPLTEEKWNQMLAVLNAMKPALVHDGNGQESQEEPEG